MPRIPSDSFRVSMSASSAGSLSTRSKNAIKACVSSVCMQLSLGVRLRFGVCAAEGIEFETVLFDLQNVFIWCEIDTKASTRIALRDEDDIGERRRIPHAESARRLRHLALEGLQPPSDPFLHPGIGVHAELAQTGGGRQVLKGLDARVDHLDELPDLAPQVGVAR